MSIFKISKNKKLISSTKLKYIEWVLTTRELNLIEYENSIEKLLVGFVIVFFFYFFFFGLLLRFSPINTYMILKQQPVPCVQLLLYDFSGSTTTDLHRCALYHHRMRLLLVAYCKLCFRLCEPRPSGFSLRLVFVR